MQNKTPIITLSSNDTNITIKQDSVNVQKAYNLTVGKKNYTHTISLLSVEELKEVAQAIELYLTIID